MCFFLCSYYKLNSLCIFISSYSWSIGGQGHRWCHHWQVFASLLRKKQIDSMLPRFCVISGMNISDTHGCTLWATFWFIPHFHIIYDLLVILNRGIATWNQLFKWFMMYSESNMSLQIILYTTKNCFPKHVILTSLFLDLIKYYIENCLRKKNLVCIVESPLHWSVFYISLLMAWIIFNVHLNNFFQCFVLLGRKLWIMLIHSKESLTTFINGLKYINLDRHINLLLLLMGEFASHSHFLHFLYWVSNN